jgi:hypothetical protein
MKSFFYAAAFSLLPGWLQTIIRIIWMIMITLIVLYLYRVDFFSILYADVLTPLGHVLGKLFGTLGDGIWFTLTGDCPKQYSSCKLPI